MAEVVLGSVEENEVTKVRQSLFQMGQQFKCLVCSRISTSRMDNVLHVRTHLHPLPYRCMLCSARFLSPWQLTEHIKIHPQEKEAPSPSSFHCPLCCRSFSSQRGVALHKLKTHDRFLTKFPCQLCTIVLPSKSSLEQHLALHHGDADRAPAATTQALLHTTTCTPTRKRGTRSFQCGKCHKRFQDIKTLNYHVAFH